MKNDLRINYIRAIEKFNKSLYALLKKDELNKVDYNTKIENLTKRLTKFEKVELYSSLHKKT